MADYQEIYDDKTKQRIQARFGREMAEMRTLGFTEAFYVGEIVSENLNPLWWVILFPVVGYQASLLRDVITVNHKLDVITYMPYFIHEDVYCYSLIESWGISYTTMFTDGSILETASYSLWSSHPEHKLLRQRCTGGSVATWNFHRASVEQWVNEGRETLSIHTNKDALAIEKRKNEMDHGMTPITGPGSHRKEKSEI